MSTGRQLFYALVVVTLGLLSSESLAKVDTSENAINNLYENLLQREYAGPVVFPNHQVERKAQRSPSLRLRFGRRSDPDLMPSAPQKRWFGDVNQKPIRSPSLRLRFGRRSDPSMPLHGSFDELMNNGGSGVAGVAAADYDEDFDVAAFERVLRKPQRLRWGRSVPFEGAVIGGGQEDNLLDEDTDRLQIKDYYSALLNAEKLRNMLLALRNYNDEARIEDNEEEFEREVRKPGPLRLRWGRSTGGRTAVSAALNNEVQQKTSADMQSVAADAEPEKISA